MFPRIRVLFSAFAMLVLVLQPFGYVGAMQNMQSGCEMVSMKDAHEHGFHLLESQSQKTPFLDNESASCCDFGCDCIASGCASALTPPVSTISLVPSIVLNISPLSIQWFANATIKPLLRPPIPA